MQERLEQLLKSARSAQHDDQRTQVDSNQAPRTPFTSTMSTTKSSHRHRSDIETTGYLLDRWDGEPSANEPWNPVRGQYGLDRASKAQGRMRGAVSARWSLDGSEHRADGQAHSLKGDRNSRTELDASLVGVGSWASKEFGVK